MPSFNSTAAHTVAHQDYVAISRDCAVQFRADAQPEIQWKHIDGPLLHGRGGQIHWLTMGERLLCAMSLADAHALERKHWPKFVARWEALAAAKGGAA